MLEQLTDLIKWPFDADQHDPLTALRIPVTSAWPGWRYIATFDRESPVRPTEQEARMIASYIDYYKDHWYASHFRAKLAERPLDVESGVNTMIFRKYAENDWGYRRASWEYGPTFVPQSPAWGHRELGPLTLLQVLDRAQSAGDDVYPSWRTWKEKYPEIFCDAS